MKPHLILAALEEAVRLEPQGIGRFGTGAAYARSRARHLITAARSDLDCGDSDLPAIDTALRNWIADGPDWDTQEYQDGYLDVQETIGRILDGDPEEIRDLLDDARRRTAQLAQEAEAA